MRRFLIGASTLALAVVLGTTSASAQFFVGAGATMPSSDYGDADAGNAKTGWMAEAGYGIFESENGQLGIWLSGIYGSNNVDDDSGNKYNLYGGFGSVTYALTQGGSATPYVIGSAGYLNRQNKPDAGESTNDGFMAFGGGAGLSFNGKFYVEGRYMTGTKDDATTAFIMLMAGITL